LNYDNDDDNLSHVKPRYTAKYLTFLVLILVNALIGLEQTVISLIGKREFGIESNAIIIIICSQFQNGKSQDYML
jgi:hypothetical protein